MNEDIEKAALAFVETDGYDSEYEKDQRMYDFESGAKYVLKRIFSAYLDGTLDFRVWYAK